MRSRIVTSFALSTLATTGGLAAFQPVAVHAAGATGAVTPTFNANEVAFQGTGDYIAGGGSFDFAALNVSTTVVSGAPHAVNVSFGGSWQLDLGAPAGQALAVGTYTGATRYPFNTGTQPGLSLFGDGRGCNNDYGSFTIYQLVTDSAGNVTSLDASFAQSCEQISGPPVIGFVHYNATAVASWSPSTPTLTATRSSSLGAHAVVTGFEALPSDAQSAALFNFGDTSEAVLGAGMAADHAYTTGGHYTVVANEYVADASGLQHWTQSTSVDNAPPVPVLKASVGNVDPATGMDVVTLDASGTTGAGTGATYTFDFGDGTTPQTSSNPVVTRPEWEGTYKVAVTVTTAWNQTTNSAPQWLTVGDGYHPVPPARLLDTRTGLGAPAGKTRAATLQLPDSVLNNPDGPVTAVVLNVTVTDTTSSGNVKVYPHGVSTIPTTSNLNFTPGLTVANLVTVPVIDGKVQMDVTSLGTVSLVADLSGYYTAGASGSGFAPVTPVRLMDTRNGDAGGRVKGYGKVSLPVPANVPADATAVALNVTAVNTGASGDLDIYPDVPGQATPVISNLNFGPGMTVPNLVIVPISADRRIDFYLHSPGSADLLADINGYFSPTATSKFVPWYPTRLLDTRNGDAGGILKSGWEIQAPIGQIFQVPNSALTAGLYNVTVTEPAGPGHITVYPDGLTQPPTVSNLNYTSGQTVPNAVLAPMTDGVQNIYNYGASTQLIVDFFGYFAEPLSTEAPAGSATKTAKMNTAVVGTADGKIGSRAFAPAGGLAITMRVGF